jgi:hypothetical protein
MRHDNEQEKGEMVCGSNMSVAEDARIARPATAAVVQPGAKRALDEAEMYAQSCCHAAEAAERGMDDGQQESKRSKLMAGMQAAGLGGDALALPSAAPAWRALAQTATPQLVGARAGSAAVDFDRATALPPGHRAEKRACAQRTTPTDDLAESLAAGTLQRVALRYAEKHRARSARAPIEPAVVPPGSAVVALAAAAEACKPAAPTADRPKDVRPANHEVRYAERAREWCARLKELVTGDLELSTERTKLCIARAVPAPDDPACGVPEQVLARAAPMSRAFGSLYEASTQSQMRLRLLTVLYRLVMVQ